MQLAGEAWKAVVLGVVEGVTEFLPVSSTAHLLIASRLLGFEQTDAGTFEVFIQFGAVLAVLGFYARELLSQARDIGRDARTRRFWLAIVLAFLPAALAGVVLRDWVKQVLFASPQVIAWALILGGIALILAERVPRRGAAGPAPWPAKGSAGPPAVPVISIVQALWIGFAQALALVPGVSRSGAAIVGGLLVGLDRATATRFSFYLAIPTLGAATVYDLAKSSGRLTASDLWLLLLGTVVAGLVAGASISWLLRYVSRHTFVPFGIYRIVAGVALLILSATRGL
jgi:undecaprenyl-diphosphatase